MEVDLKKSAVDMAFTGELTAWSDVEKLRTAPDELDEQRGPQSVFRGVPDATFQLEPSIVRLLKEANCGDPNNQEHVKRAVQLEEKSFEVFRMSQGGPVHVPEWIPGWAVAQHYGGATRALDWSADLGVALYFAVSNHPTTDAAFYVLQQRELRPEARPEDLEIVDVYNEECKVRGWPARRDEGWLIQQKIFREGRPLWMHVCTTIRTPARLQEQAGYLTTSTNILADHGAVINQRYKAGTLAKYRIPKTAKARLMAEAADRQYSGLRLFHDSRECTGRAQRDAMVAGMLGLTIRTQ